MRQVLYKIYGISKDREKICFTTEDMHKAIRWVKAIRKIYAQHYEVTAYYPPFENVFHEKVLPTNSGEYKTARDAVNAILSFYL